jgi:hypothetical protein
MKGISLDQRNYWELIGATEVQQVNHWEFESCCTLVDFW